MQVFDQRQHGTDRCLDPTNHIGNPGQAGPLGRPVTPLSSDQLESSLDRRYHDGLKQPGTRIESAKGRSSCAVMRLRGWQRSRQSFREESCRYACLALHIAACNTTLMSTLNYPVA